MWETTDTATLDGLEMELVGLELHIARCRSRQLTLLGALDGAGVAALDGARTMAEWTVSRLDVTRDTATVLVDTARTLPDHPDLAGELADGTASFDRIAATVTLAETGADGQTLTDSRGLDLAGVSRLRAQQRTITETEERMLFRDRYVAIQPSLDESLWRLHGRLGGYEGAVVAQALFERGDALHTDPDLRGTRGQRAADALYSMALDTLDQPQAPPAPHQGPTEPDTSPPTGNGSRVPLVSVFVDAHLAAASGGEAGVALAAGPRLGPALLAKLLCDGKVEINLTGATPLAVGPTATVVPPRLRRSVLQRDGGCVISGCHSHYRIEIHHLTPLSEGGLTVAANLVTLCWFHHHVIIHRRGMRIDPASPPRNRRFLRPQPH